MKKLKINFVFHNYPEFYQPYIDNLIQKIEENKSISLSFTSFKRNKLKNQKTIVIPNYLIRRIKEKCYTFLYSKYQSLSYPEILWLKKKYDIIHLQHSFLHPHIVNLIDNFDSESRPKIVITLRGGDTYIKPWVMDRWKEFYTKYGNKIDAFITVSVNQKEYLTKWGIEKNRIHTIPISFGEKSSNRPKYPNKKEIMIVSAFRMCWEKNIDANIRVIKDLIDKGYKLQYHVFGDGKDLGQLFYLADKYNLKDYINYKGKIDNKEFKKILVNYDFYLQLSLSESAGAAVLEAQSCGVPCIVSNVGGLPEIIKNEATGFTMPYFDIDQASRCILALYNDRDRYYSFSKNAIEFVNENYTVDIEAEQYLKLYSNLLN